MLVASVQMRHHVVELVELTLNRRVIEELRRGTVTGGQFLTGNSVDDAPGAGANASVLVYAEGTYPVFNA